MENKYGKNEKILTLNKKETALAIVCAFLGGVIVGFFLAPIKKGIYCGNNNGNQSLREFYDEFDDDEVLHFK